MTKHFLAASFLTLVALAGSSTVWSADAVTDAAQVKRQAASMAEIKALTESEGGYKTRNVELSSTAHQMTITIVNGELNTGVIAAREAEATRIVSAVARVIADKPEFSKLPVIHVDYVKRQGKKTRPVQRFDFFQSPAGVFVLHKT
jgi:hypothetical protein